MKKKREVSCEPIGCSFKMKVILSVVITHVRIATDFGKLTGSGIKQRDDLGLRACKRTLAQNWMAAILKVYLLKFPGLSLGSPCLSEACSDANAHGTQWHLGCISRKGRVQSREPALWLYSPSRMSGSQPGLGSCLSCSHLSCS